MLKTVTGKVACTPFPDQSVKTSMVGDGPIKAMRIENRATLAELSVVFPSEDGRWAAGDKVYVSAKLYTLPWAREVQWLKDSRFILVPDSAVECFVKGAV